MREGALEATAEHGGRGEARLLGDLLYLQVGGLQQAPGDLQPVLAEVLHRRQPGGAEEAPHQGPWGDIELPGQLGQGQLPGEVQADAVARRIDQPVVAAGFEKHRQRRVLVADGEVVRSELRRAVAEKALDHQQQRLEGRRRGRGGLRRLARFELNLIRWRLRRRVVHYSIRPV